MVFDEFKSLKLYEMGNLYPINWATSSFDLSVHRRIIKPGYNLYLGGRGN